MLIVCKTTDQKETNGDENGDKYEIPDQNKECVFPFQYRGETFDSCTNFGCPECFWCGTQYDVTDTIGWGICNEACPTQEYIESKRLKQNNRKYWISLLFYVGLIEN